MKLNYTRKVVLELGAYTFAISLALIMFGGIIFELFIDRWGERNINEVTSVVENIMAGGSGESFDLENLTFYIQPTQIPEAFSSITTPGISTLESGYKLYVGTHPATGQLYYVEMAPYGKIEIEDDDWLDLLSLFFYVVMIALAVTALSWRMAKRLVSPVLQLKQQVDQVNDTHTQLQALDRDDEIGELSRAFSQMVGRLQAFVAREKEFTRFASHELRSPVTILQGNLDLVREIVPDTPIGKRAISRMDTASRRMMMIIESFLWLARESKQNGENGISEVDSDTLEILLAELEQGFAERDWQRFTITSEPVSWRLNPILLSLLIDNLCRNALRHCNGDIDIQINSDGFRISNPIVDGQQQSGTGFGLQIVERICQHNGWKLEINQNDGRFCVDVQLMTATTDHAPQPE